MDRHAQAAERLRVAAKERQQSPEGFVKELQNAMAELQVPLADRSFRKNFSRNYKVLFQANPNGYRVEVLESVLDLNATVYVNRRMHWITGLSMRKGHVLQQPLSQLFSLLESSEVKLGALWKLLQDLDEAWMEFEKHYIMDLIDIEAEARQPVADAVTLELQLRQAEEQRPPREEEEVHWLGRRERLPWTAQVEEHNVCDHAIRGAGVVPRSMPSISAVSQWLAKRTSTQNETPLDLQQLAVSAASEANASASELERTEKMKELLRKVCEINSNANVRGRGRPQMGFHVLQAAADDFLACQASEPTLETSVQAAFAKHVLEGFLHLRSYLFDMRGRMLEIDPQLQNNRQLQNCLVAYEDAWELGSRFLRPHDVSGALCSVAAQLGTLQQEHQDFASLVESQEAELFLVLPRLVLLCSLAGPERSSPFTATMLPSHFEEVSEGDDLGPDFSRTAEWDELLKKFKDLEQERSWRQLVENALRGPSSAQDEPMKAFLTQLEALGFELTRRRPEEWNSCCSLLLRCSMAVLDKAQTT